MTEDDHYDVLQVAPHARPEVIQAAFEVLREMACRDHGDDAPRTLVRLNRARRVLGDARLRAEYDGRREEGEG